jgi:hypothetical protein
MRNRGSWLVSVLVLAACSGRGLQTSGVDGGTPDSSPGPVDASVDSEQPDTSVSPSVDAGSSGTCGLGPDAGGLGFPGAAPILLDPNALPTSTLVVSPDEAHVAVVTPGPYPGNTYALTVDTVGAGGAVTSVGVGEIVPNTVMYTPDGSHLVYVRASANSCDGLGLEGQLEIAAPDGTSPAVVGDGVRSISLAGPAVLFETEGCSTTLAKYAYYSVTPGNGPAQLTAANFTGWVYPDPGGRGIVYGTYSSSACWTLGPLMLENLDGTSPIQLSSGGTADPWNLVVWAPNGAVAFGHGEAKVVCGGGAETLTVISPDRSKRTDVATDFQGGSVAFSPDGNLVAYDYFDNTNLSIAARVHSLSAGTETDWGDFVAPFGCGTAADGRGSFGKFFFSPSGALLFADNDLQTPGTTNVLAWGRIADGHFQSAEISPFNDADLTLSPDERFLAYTNTTDLVVQGLGSAPGTTLPLVVCGFETPVPLLFEPQSTGTHLFEARSYDANSGEIVNEDGSGTPTSLPGAGFIGANAIGERWIGPRLVYLTNYRNHPCGVMGWGVIDYDLVLSNDTGATAGVALTNVVQYATSPVGTPTRLFAVRDSLGAGCGMGGLYMIPVP